MTVKVEKLSEATFHPYAECTDEECGWEAPTSSWTRSEAKHHARATGHNVRVVVERIALWGPR